MSWQAIVSSVIGTRHIKKGVSCQDYGDYKILSEGHVIIGAVSDGMGSAKHSEIGSELAVKVAISELKRENWQSQPKDEIQVKNFFINILEVIRAKFQDYSESESYSIQDLACTLLVFIATPQWLIAMQIGDGFIVVRSQYGDYQLLFKPDKGEFFNEATSITSDDALDQIQICIKSNVFQFICAATDGIENISLIYQENWKPYDKFFRPLEQHMLSKDSLSQKNQELNNFLNSERVNKNTNDDKSLILCVYQQV